MNAKNKQDLKNQGQKTRQMQRSKTQSALNDDRKYHEQERPETRMFR